MHRRVYEYIPQYLRGIVELYEIAYVFDCYIEELYGAVSRGIYEKRISHASEERILEWERLLNISPYGTLAQRRNVLKSIMQKNRRIDEKTVSAMVQVITGGRVYMDFFDSTVIIRVRDGDDPLRLSEAKRALEKALPAHLCVSVREFYPVWNDVRNSFGTWGDIMQLLSWGELYEERL